MTGQKDIVKVKHDLQHKGIISHLWLTANLRRGGKMLKLAIGYVLTTTEFDYFATTIENMKIPSRHVSAMGKHIRKKNFGALKSHDYHVLMQHVLPLSLRRLFALGP